MITSWNVLSVLKQLCSTDEDNEEELLALCSFALDSVLTRLKDTADKNDMRITYAAAATALYNLTMKRADSVSSFKAGDISISNSFSDKLKFAQKLKNDALRDIYPLFKDEGFFTGSVLIESK